LFFKKLGLILKMRNYKNGNIGLLGMITCSAVVIFGVTACAGGGGAAP